MSANSTLVLLLVLQLLDVILSFCFVNTIDHFNLKLVSQVDVDTNSGATSLKEGMIVICLDALHMYLQVVSHQPFAWNKSWLLQRSQI